ncbi:MAG: hypothetical protein HY303_01485 [Candidatus Wallbacteria bacterium]|nr:hypothetical protein [Candidatus Wallbacteria bacterium]
MLRAVHRLPLFALACALSLPACGAELLPAQALLLPGVAGLLPKGTVAGLPEEHPDKPVLTRSVMLTSATTRPGPLRLALVVLEPAGGSRRARLLAMRPRGSKMVSELDVTSEAPDFLDLRLGAFRPGGGAVLGVQWAGGPGPHEGLLQIWALGDDGPIESFHSNAEGFYFEDVDGSGHAQLVLYAPEADSLVFLPRVFDWQGNRLVESKGRHDRFDKRLLADYDEVLDSWRAAAQPGDPPRMVMDVALQKGRLLERRSEKAAAFNAYEQAIDLVPDNLELAEERQAYQRREVLERVVEARRRATVLYGFRPR